MPISIILLLCVLLGIAFRKVIPSLIPIWVFMLMGAIFSLIFQQITPLNAIKAINTDVMLYLFGVFILCQAAEDSGYLEHITDKLFTHAATGKVALWIIVFILGLSAALLMNDTIAIVGTPIILQLCRSHPHLVKPLLLALAYAITIGSIPTPVGNPQNLLIAVKSEMLSPILIFAKHLIIPTIINLGVVFVFIFYCYRKVLNQTIEKPTPMPIDDKRTVSLVKSGLFVMLLLIVLKLFADFYQWFSLPFSVIAIAASTPVVLFSKKLWKILKNIDWGTLIFFASLFILMQSVWDSHFFQSLAHQSKLALDQPSTIFIVSVTLSQFISNVPLVALYLPFLSQGGLVSQWLALAAGSTIAGNLSLLGAASNVIILQNAEKRGNKGFGFFEFSLLGIPLTIIHILIYGWFLQ